MALMLKAFVVVWLCSDWSVALPGGAPSLACSSMTPFHFAFQSQPLEESPFFVRQSKIQYNGSNDTVVVALTSSNGRSFKGFLVKAFNPVSNRPIGKFREDTGVARRDSCHAATHVNAEEKNIVIVHWSADEVEEDNDFVVFEATFVESFRKFYVGVESTIKGRKAREAIETLRKSEKEKARDDLSADKNPPKTKISHVFWH